MATTLQELEKAFEVTLDAEQKRKMRLYLDLTQKWNRRINLTAIKGIDAFLQFHFYESFWAARRFLAEDTRLADVGSGAGFPGLPMKIYYPSLSVTLIEQNLKKIVFLKEVCRVLDLAVTIVQAKGEDYWAWENFDVAVLRALKPTPRLLEVLSRHRVRLLLLHGRDMGALVENLEVLSHLKVPLSRDRWATLFQC